MGCVCVCVKIILATHLFRVTQGGPSVISMEVSSGPENGTRPAASGDAAPAQSIDPKVVKQHCYDCYVVKHCPNISKVSKSLTNTALIPALGVFVWLRLFYVEDALRVGTLSRWGVLQRIKKEQNSEGEPLAECKQHQEQHKDQRKLRALNWFPHLSYIGLGYQAKNDPALTAKKTAQTGQTRNHCTLWGSRAHRSDQLDSPFLQTQRVKNGILRHYQYYLSASKTLDALAMQWSQKYSGILCDTASRRVPWQMSIVCDTGYLCVCMNPCKGSKNKSLTALNMYFLRETRSTHYFDLETNQFAFQFLSNLAGIGWPNQHVKTITTLCASSPRTKSTGRPHNLGQR